jgi:hypothetical protein
MLRVAGEHALERHVILAEELRAATGLVGDREHTVDVRIVTLHVAEAVLHELAYAGRAVHARDDRDVVARADPAVVALEAVEGAHPLRGMEIDRAHVHPALVAVGAQIADAEVLRVDVVSDRDVARREADHLAVAANGSAGGHRVPGHLVAGLDVLAHLDPVSTILQDRTRGQLRLCDRDVVL